MEISSISIYQGLAVVVLSSLVLFMIITLSKKKPEWGGILSSFPTSVALILIFTAIFNGAQTARSVALSLSAAIVLFNMWIFLYYTLSKRTKGFVTVLLSLLLLALAALLYQFSHLPFTILVVLYAAVWLLGIGFFYSKIKKINKTHVDEKGKLYTLIITCAVYVACIVLLSKFTPALITAILSAFPTSALFGAYYNQQVSRPNLIRFLGSMYIATPTISLFCLVVALTTSLNITWSFIAGFVVAIILALTFSRFIRRNI